MGEPKWTKREMTAFITQYAPMMHIFVARWGVPEEEVEDILQEGYLRLWTHRDTLGTVRDIRLYFMAILRNCITDRWQAHSRDLPLDDAYLEISSNETFLNNIVAAESARIIAAALDTLSPQTRRIIDMSLQGKKMQEIADTLGISLNTVKTLKYRAIERLSHILRREDFLLIINLMAVSYFFPA